MRRDSFAALAVPVLAVGLCGCGGDPEVSSQCRTSADAGQCAVKLTLEAGRPYDFVVEAPTMPVLGGAVRVEAFVQVGRSPVRVWWRDAAGTDVTGTAAPGRPGTVRGTAGVQDQGGRQRFVIHFEASGADQGTVDATITYG